MESISINNCNNKAYEKEFVFIDVAVYSDGMCFCVATLLQEG